MVLKAAYDPAQMLDELRAADDYQEPFFQDWEDDIARYYGPGFRKDMDNESYDPENFALEWSTLVAAQLVFGNPRVRTKTNRLGGQRDLVKAHEYALNRWIRDSRTRKLNEKLAIDFGQRWGVTVTLPGWQPGHSEHEDPRGWPTVKRISPTRFGWDPVAIEWEECRFYYHKTIHDKEDLQDLAEEDKDAGWNREAIDALTESAGLDEIRDTNRNDLIPDRGEVVIYNVYVPGYEPDEEDIKFHGKDAWEREGVWGAWLTLGVGQDPEGGTKFDWVKRPEPYWGRRRGPYTLIGHMVIPDEVGLLGPVSAIKGQNDALNDHARAMDRAMNLHKRGILVDGTDPAWEDRIRDFEDHFVVALDGLEDIASKVMQVEIAGATDLHVSHNSILLDRRSRVSGMSEAMQGRPDPNVSATADSTAAEAGGHRIGFQGQKFRDGVQDYLEAVSWYLVHQEDLEIELGPEAEGQFIDEITGQPIERPVYYGGLDDEESEEDLWESIGIEIEPYSMEKTSEALQQRRMMEIANVIGWIVPMMARYPYVEWDKLIELIGETMNLPNLGDFFDMDGLKEFRAVVMQMELEGGQGGAAKPQPRIARDTSNRGTQFAPSAGSFGSLGGGEASPVGQMLGNLTGAAVGAGAG